MWKREEPELRSTLVPESLPDDGDCSVTSSALVSTSSSSNTARLSYVTDDVGFAGDDTARKFDDGLNVAGGCLNTSVPVMLRFGVAGNRSDEVDSDVLRRVLVLCNSARYSVDACIPLPAPAHDALLLSSAAFNLARSANCATFDVFVVGVKSNAGAECVCGRRVDD